MGKKVFSTTIFLLFITLLQGQVVKNKKSSDKDLVFEKVPIEANTNEKAWAEHIKRKTQLPDSITKNIPAGTYMITVQFVIDTHGSIGQIKALNDPGYGLALNAEKIISTYKGEWSPAVQCGRQVKAYRKQLITFTIAE